jgi:O-methyltransferase
MPDITHPLDESWRKGDLASPVENVKALFSDSPRVNIVPGFFSETLPLHPDLKFCFCHVDADLYTSIRECIDYILPRLSVGGAIVFDDYGFRNTPGAKAAVEESFGQPYPSFIPLPTGQAVYIAQPWHRVREATPPAKHATVV